MSKGEHNAKWIKCPYLVFRVSPTYYPLYHPKDEDLEEEQDYVVCLKGKMTGDFECCKYCSAKIKGVK